MYVIFRVKQKVKQTKITTKSHTFFRLQKIAPQGETNLFKVGMIIEEYKKHNRC